MTDEECQKLCMDLRDPFGLRPETNAHLCNCAADEIERQKRKVAEWKDLYNQCNLLRRQHLEEIERLAVLAEDYKLVFGDIHDVHIAEMKTRVKKYERDEYD